MANFRKNQVAKVTNVELSSNVPSIGDFNYDKKVANLTAEDKEKCRTLTQKLSLDDMSSVQTYGSELSNIISTNGDELLKTVRANNTNEVVAMTHELLTQLKLIDIDDLGDSKWKRFLRNVPILRRFITSIDDLFDKYDNIQDNLGKIQNKIVQAKQVAQRDNSTLEQIFDNDVNYIEQLRELIVAAKLKRNEMAEEAEKMKTNPDIESYQINDANIFINSLDKRIADMESQEYILEQNLFQIRATQHNNVAIADKADNIVRNVIPIWKDQIALSVIMDNQKASVEAEGMLADFTNQLFEKNSELMKINSINVAKDSERPLINKETMEKMTNNLIETLNEMKKISDEGVRNRAELEKSLQTFAGRLNTAISNQ